jgi:2-polyprenyl-3-methyl-5-hydroxy-6-metoxy-1,4-benzoquinol methylase
VTDPALRTTIAPYARHRYPATLFRDVKRGTRAMKTVEEAFREYEFYHCIELAPGVVTPGWKDVIPLQRPVSEAIKSLDLTGKKVIDIGCRDGLFSFEAEQRGASTIFGIDNDLSRPAVEFLIPYLHSSVRIEQMNVYDLQVSPDERYDVAIFAGVLYHLRFPFYGLKRVADAVKPGGFMILETALLLSHHRYPFLYCPRPEDSPYEPTSVTFFNHLALVAAIESVGFTEATCTSVIAGVNDGTVHGSQSWESFVAEQPVVVASDGIVVGRGTYICRRQETEDRSALENYWYGSHNLNSEAEANRVFLEGASRVSKLECELASARSIVND